MIVRPARIEDAPAIAEVHVETWREAYSGLMPSDNLAGLSVERRAEIWRSMLSGQFPGVHVRVAETPDTGVFGFAAGGAARGENPPLDGELHAINIVRRHHRHGAGRRLVLEIARCVATGGHRGMMLWVLAANPARGFYERLGAEPLGRSKTATFGAAELEEVAYGWRSIDELLKQNS